MSKEKPKSVNIQVVPNRRALALCKKSSLNTAFVMAWWDSDVRRKVRELNRKKPCNLLVLHFPDTEDPGLAHLFGGVVFNEEMAEKVAKFLMNNLRRGVANFVFSCDVGVSRSAGMAMAFEQFLREQNIRVKTSFRNTPFPNEYVKNLLLKKLES